MKLDRRTLIIATPLLLAVVAAGDKAGNTADIKSAPAPAPAVGPDPRETLVLPYERIGFEPWGNLPPASGEMATLYGDLNKPGPYLVMMRWNPGFFSTPHSYATDRICVVLFGTWFVNSGAEFQPQDAIPVGPGGFVKRTARTPHYDGVPANQPDAAVIAIFGLGPVDMELVDPTQPPWRHV